MSEIEYNNIISLGKVLKSKNCLLVLKFLTQGDAPNQDIYEKLKVKIGTDHRSSIFASLKKIKDAGLVKKYYDDGSNKIMYKLTIKAISLDFENMELKKE